MVVWCTQNVRPDGSRSTQHQLYYNSVVNTSRSVSSVQDGIYALGKAHMRSIPSLRRFPNFPFEAVVRLSDDGPLSFFKGRSSSASSVHAFLLQTIDDVMSLPLCPQVVSQVSQHFRSSEKQGTSEGCFTRQSILSVISLHSDMSRVVLHPQEFSKMDVDHRHIPVWASHYTFHFL